MNAGAPHFNSSIKQQIVLIVFVVLLTAIFTVQHFAPINGRWDFESFYLAAKMVRAGDGHRLYDLSTQAAYQRRYIDPARAVTEPDLPFLYPAATTLLFLPLAWLPLTLAFSAWTAFSLAVLVLTVRVLQRHLRIAQNDRPIFAALLFLPIFVCLLHGQLSILVLFLYAVAFSCFKRGNSFAAGVVLGLGTLKFQVMLGFFAILLLRRCWKCLAGVAVGSVPVALLSAAVLGWRGAMWYPLTVTQLAHIPSFDTARSMISLYGFLTTALGHQPPAWLVLILSGGMVLAAALVQNDSELAFSVGMLAAMLVSYHAFLQELTLMLLPVAVIASRIKRERELVFWFGSALGTAAIFVSLRSVQAGAAAILALVVGFLWSVRSRAARFAVVPDESPSAQKACF